MNYPGNRIVLLTAGLCILLAGCAGMGVVPIGTGAAVELQEDETRLWNRAAEEQRRLDRSGVIYDDPQLQAYLNEVISRLTPEGVKRTEFSFKVSVIKNPLLNASAATDKTWRSAPKKMGGPKGPPRF